MSEGKIVKKAARPRVNSKGQQELEKVKAKIDEFTEKVESLELDRSKNLPKEETEPQTKLSQEDLRKAKEIYLKPKRTVSCKEKFNETFRQDYNFAKEMVHFIAEHNEIIGEDLEFWTRPFPGMPAEEWRVPVNKPVWAPRYVAEQIKRKYYHRLKMDESKTRADGDATMFGAMVMDTTVQRIDARPVNSGKSLFMGASGF